MARRHALRSCASSLAIDGSFRQGKPEGAAVSLGGFEIKRSSTDLDIPAYHRKTHAAAFHLILRLQGFEQPENLCMKLSRDAGAVVLDRKHVVRATIFQRYLDVSFVPVV